jgi:hypothetical protein
MIYLFCGDDAKNKLAAYENFVKTLQSEGEIIFLNKNNFDKTQLQSLYSGAGLFSPKFLVVLSGVLESEYTRDFVLEKLDSFTLSSNNFCFLEGKLTKTLLDTFKKHRAEINIFELSKEKKEKYDNFLLANAFGARDKLNLWVCFRQAMDLGVGMEELVGVLFWKIKDLILKKDFRKFTEKELQNHAAKLAYLLPEARKEGRDAETAFEEFLLQMF